MGVRDCAIIGVENLMWGSDYPHQESTWPTSQEMLDTMLADVPEAEQALITGEHVTRSYQFEAAPCRRHRCGKLCGAALQWGRPGETLLGQP